MNPIAKMNVGVSGVFELSVKHADGRITDYGKSKNKIVNQGLDALGGLFPANYGTTAQGAIVVGTGNTAPTATNTTMQAGLAFTNNVTSGPTNSNNQTPPYSTTATFQYTFAVGAVVGNIAEVGMLLNRTTGSQTAGDAIFSRALILVGGLPGTITLLATDQLIVTYSLTYSYAADTTGSIVVTTDGVAAPANNFTVRPSNLAVGSYFYFSIFQPFNIVNLGGTLEGGSCSDTVFQPTSGSPTLAVGLSSFTASAYTGGSYTRNFNMHWNTANATSRVMYWVWMNCMGFQMLFTTAFGPTAAQTMDLALTLSWAAT